MNAGASRICLQRAAKCIFPRRTREAAAGPLSRHAIGIRRAERGWQGDTDGWIKAIEITV
jgi:hypothetical protein